MYEVPQFSCVETVDMYAAKNDATSIPFKPGGRWSRIAYTKPTRFSCGPRPG